MLKEVEEKIEYVFRDKSLLDVAFHHSSYAHEANCPDNERMEFLGDAVLQLTTSHYLYTHFPERSAGELSKARAAAVSSSALQKAVERIGILPYLKVSDGARNLLSQSPKLCANLFEAVLGAVYLDGGLPAAEKFVTLSLKDTLDAFSPTDSKSALQEYCQGKKIRLEYRLLSRSGPDNKPLFVYRAYLDGKPFSTGQGSTIKRAQAQAAEKTLQRLRRHTTENA